MALVFEVAVFTHFSNLVCFLSWCMSGAVSWICFTMPQCLFQNWYPPPFPPTLPQVCRLHSWDAEADPGADAGWSLTVLYLVHTNLSEQSDSPPLHCRWVHGNITVKVTLRTGRAAGMQPRAKMNSVGSSGFFFQTDLQSSLNYSMDLFKTTGVFSVYCSLVHIVQCVSWMCITQYGFKQPESLKSPLKPCSYCFISIVGEQSQNYFSLSLSLSKYLQTALYIWYIFSITNPLVDITDKPIRDISGFSCLFLSQTSKHTRMLLKATDSSHHHPSSFSRHWHRSLLSHVLLSQTLAVCSSQAPTLFMHLVYHTRGCCDTATQSAKNTSSSQCGMVSSTHIHTHQSHLQFSEQVTSLLKN